LGSLGFGVVGRHGKSQRARNWEVIFGNILKTNHYSQSVGWPDIPDFLNSFLKNLRKTFKEKPIDIAYPLCYYGIVLMVTIPYP
jgi:hypothetical protein